MSKMAKNRFERGVDKTADVVKKIGRKLTDGSMDAETSQLFLDFLRNKTMFSDATLAKEIGTNVQYLKSIDNGLRGFSKEHLKNIEENIPGYSGEFLDLVSANFLKSLGKKGQQIKVTVVDTVRGTVSTIKDNAEPVVQQVADGAERAMDTAAEFIIKTAKQGSILAAQFLVKLTKKD